MLSLLYILQLNFTVLLVYIYVLLLISYMYCMFQLKIKKLFLFLFLGGGCAEKLQCYKLVSGTGWVGGLVL